MTPQAIAILNAARLKAQRALFGKPVKLNGAVDDPVRMGIPNGPRFEARLAQGGDKIGHDCTLRLIKEDWPEVTSSESFKKAKVEIELAVGSWASFKVESVTDVLHGGEWKLSLNALT